MLFIRTFPPTLMRNAVRFRHYRGHTKYQYRLKKKAPVLPGAFFLQISAVIQHPCIWQRTFLQRPSSLCREDCSLHLLHNRVERYVPRMLYKYRQEKMGFLYKCLKMHNKFQYYIRPSSLKTEPSLWILLKTHNTSPSPKNKKLTLSFPNCIQLDSLPSRYIRPRGPTDKWLS